METSNITTLHCQASFSCVRFARAGLCSVEEGLELSEVGFDLGEINTIGTGAYLPPNWY